ncbi:MAG: hypothetical protein TR69_WS6001000580 [candidate division WS6 bacterium OLB20]|uniref:Uncharacterized protein n=1 Tax=candidate division WS6 bacterium OLB20 TaxID=1617426 RepID=A0A136LY31_9BACT|nr:MAG: hypothetical protein TR69_WS6001000580 [candidate division WS6 bacterium OLB20]
MKPNILLTIVFSALISAAFGLFAASPADAAISYAGGWYTNLCGNSTADAYNCPANCNPYNGSCSGSYVYKFTCNGQTNECVSNGTGPSTFQSFDTGICNQTQQIDVFNQNCGPVSNWQCPGTSALTGFMVWYKPSCCQNTCQGARDPEKPGNPYPHNVTLNSYTVNFSWSHNDFGSCGGNTCNNTCNSPVPGSNRYSLYVDGVRVYRGNNKSFTYTVTGQNHTWYVVAHSNCRQRQSNTWSFTVNRPPTAAAQITSNALCNANPASQGWSGVHPLRAGSGSAGINNPLQVRATYTDPDAPPI